MSGLRLGVRVPPCVRADRLVDTVRRAEELGFDRVWFPDSQLLWRDVFTVLTAAADRVREGSAGRGSAAVPLTVSAFCAVTDDVPAAARQLKPICASIAQNGGAEFLALAGIRVDVPAKVEGVYPDLVHAEDWDAALAICSAWVSDEAAVRFAEEFCLVGAADAIAERPRTLHAAGVDEVLLQHVGSYDPPTELIEAVGGSVLPALRGR